MYLGLDLGTSSLKAMVIDENQNLVAVETHGLDVSRPFDGWSEQDPADWVAACDSVMRAISRTVDMRSILGIGLSGHMHGATLLDSSDQVLRPCMLWNDTRSHAEAKALDEQDMFRKIAGNIVFPGFTAPKVEWVRKNEPEVFTKVAKILLPKDYLRLWLTGEHVSDMSDAAGTAWLDVANRRWSDDLLGACHLGQAHMPRLVEGSAPSGELRSELASAWGMDRVVVAGGAGDNAASAIGLGVVSSGQSFVSLGTSGVVFAANDAYRPKPESAVHAFCHALPDMWHQMGVILSATDSLNWFARICGKQVDELVGDLGETLHGPSDITFLPYLSGERTPHNDASIRGSFIGLGQSHEQSHLAQAVLEGVAFALADNIDALKSTGTNVERMMAVGGGSRSLYWLRTLSTVLGIPIEVPVGGDFGAAFGAARLGLLATEKSDPKDICTIPRVETVIEPELSLKEDYDQARSKFQAAYPAVKGLFRPD